MLGMADKGCTFVRKNYAGDEKARKLMFWGSKF